LLGRAASLSSATIHEAAGKIGALPSGLKSAAPSVRLCGRAFPVHSPGGDNLWLHYAIYAASPGDILVASCSGEREFGYWGEVMARAALVRGLGGLVIDGGVRDSLQMLAMGFPVFSARVCIQGTRKHPRLPGSLSAPVQIGSTVIHAGDLVVGDADGVVVIPAVSAQEVIERSFRRDREEQTIFEQLQAGRTTLEIYDLPGRGADP
jgi:4-hydroxy-4-methyl-2-oxoglutarate aldolase